MPPKRKPPYVCVQIQVKTRKLRLIFFTLTKMAAAGLSDAQIEEFREAFHLFDRNQDGTITSSNLANVLKVGIEFLFEWS